MSDLYCRAWITVTTITWVAERNVYDVSQIPKGLPVGIFTVNTMSMRGRLHGPGHPPSGWVAWRGRPPMRVTGASPSNRKKGSMVGDGTDDT